MTLPRHHASDGQQRGGAKAKFVGAQQRADDHVAGELESAVDAQADAAAQSGQHQRVVRFAQANFPGQAGVLDRSERRRAGAAVVTADGDDVSARFGDAGGDNSHAGAGHQLHADSRAED